MPIAVRYTLFFVSSRSRYTRFSRDWSSDVCSSDLRVACTVLRGAAQQCAASTRPGGATRRSEERRVGKECRSRWTAYHLKKKDVTAVHANSGEERQTVTNEVVKFNFPGLTPGPYIFFFQAEDGIRDFHVTGVQTCALPI